MPQPDKIIKKRKRRRMSVQQVAAHIIVNSHIEEAMRREQNRPSFGQWYIPPNVQIKCGGLVNSGASED